MWPFYTSEILAKLDHLTELVRLLPRARRPTRLALQLPTLVKKGQVMSNYELKNDTVATITIETTDSAGTVEPYPPGDVFSVTSSLPGSLGAAIGTDKNGNPAVVLTPLVQASPGISVTVSDSDGLQQFVQLVDIVPDVTDTNIILDLADATLASQPVPSAPGP